MKIAFLIQIALAILIFHAQTAADTVTVTGNAVRRGLYKIENGHTIADIVNESGGIPASQEMVKHFREGRIVPGVKIKLYRGKSVINIEVESGKSFFNTIKLLDNDVIRIYFDSKTFWLTFNEVIKSGNDGRRLGLKTSGVK